MLLQLPDFYKQYLRSPLDSVYKALRSKDLADCVVQAISILRETDNYLDLKVEEKSDSIALQHWISGKEAVCKGDYQNALVFYNKALMLSPVNSGAMRTSYYGRAELLLKTKRFPASVKDIQTCLGLNCPDSLVSKLQEMKAEACRFPWIEQLQNKQMSTPFTEQFFTLKGDSNPDIPCATLDVEVIMESGKPKVVAANDIPIGTVLAVETSFTGATNIFNSKTSCHYCLKINLNLIPCEGCCAVMFCDKQCQEKAAQEGHNVECKIIDMLVDDIKLPVKATLKIRQLCSSWDEFITASNNLGVDRMKDNTLANIFGSAKFSLLNSYSDTHFIYGAMFNRCMYFANIIHYLDTLTSFLPTSPEDKSAAIRAVSRVMMHLSLYCNPVQLPRVTLVHIESQIRPHIFPDKGYFPLIGNLANSCQPNSYVMGLRNSAALITIEPIQKGAEITFSYAGHWLEVASNETPELRSQKLFIHSNRTVCKDCFVCSGGVAEIFRKQPLNAAQQKAFKMFTPYACLNPQNLKKYYTITCNTLQALIDAPYSAEYYKAFVSFRQCIMHCTFCKFPNVTLSQKLIKD